MDDPFALIAREAPGAFAIHDYAGNYRWVSPGFVGGLGHEAADVVGHNVYEFVHPDDHAASQEAHRRLFEQNAHVVVRHRLRSADGSYRWVETASRLVRAERVIVATLRWVATGQAATDALAAERDLAGRRRGIDEQHRQFLTAISHRARHPVTIIRGMAELLEEHGDEVDSARRAQLVGRIASNARRLTELIEEVTRAEGLARLTDRIHVRPIHLDALVRACVTQLSDHDGPITVDVGPDTVVFGDDAMLRSALQALLDNAVEHTPRGTAIWVRTRRLHDGTVVVVEDAGPGVPTALREAVFEQFHRGDGHTADPGLGLGLHTVSEIAAVHGGRVWVEERDGGGAAFHLLLPTSPGRPVEVDRGAADASGGVRPEVPQEHGHDLRVIHDPPIRVLVADDDEVVADLLATTLATDGFDVDVCHDGAEVLRRVLEDPPDVLVCDVDMPGMNGRQVVRTIRSTPAIATLPVVLCSGRSDDDAQWRSWRSGADSFLAKPFRPDDVVAEVCRVVAVDTREAGGGVVVGDTPASNPAGQ